MSINKSLVFLQDKIMGRQTVSHVWYTAKLHLSKDGGMSLYCTGSCQFLGIKHLFLPFSVTSFHRRIFKHLLGAGFPCDKGAVLRDAV
jgi:hypothetical protein